MMMMMMMMAVVVMMMTITTLKNSLVAVGAVGMMEKVECPVVYFVIVVIITRHKAGLGQGGS